MAPADATRKPQPSDRGLARESRMHFGGAMFFTDYSMSAMELAPPTVD
jgi:hypothetical protein